MTRICILLFIFFWSTIMYGQFFDRFSDGDFTNNPTWTGDVAEFLVENGQLKTNGPATSASLYLSTPFSNPELADASWEFLINLDFAPSDRNKLRVYLTSDNADLEGTLNGYFVEIGQSGDDQIKLYRQDGDTETLLFLGATSFGGGSLTVRIRVSRDAVGNWKVFSDDMGGTTFKSEGDSFLDIAYNATSYFGVVITHTKSLRDKFYFDDFEVTSTTLVDDVAPTIISVEAINSSKVLITFSEEVETLSAKNISNYSFNHGLLVLSASISDTSPNEVILNTSALTNGQFYTLNLNGVEDLEGNIVSSNTQAVFQYLLLEEAVIGDIVINEFMADPTPATTFPASDFVELYNRSEKFISLEGWTIADEAGVSSTMEYKVLTPRNYLVLTNAVSAKGYADFGEVLGITSFPNFNASGDSIILKNSRNEIIAQLNYDSYLVNDAISAELININETCINALSYKLSIDERGASPGTQNSVFDDALDVTPPVVVSYVFDTFLTINFSEKMQNISLNVPTNYRGDGLVIDQINVEGDYPTQVELSFAEKIIPGKSYSLTISGVLDCTGNQLSDTTLRFALGRASNFNELIITEILFNENPVLGLPEREYIELFNSTSDVISTEGLVLSDATSSIVLPPFNINPNTYYILTSLNGVGEFTGNAIGVSGFPSLNNLGELLTLSFEDKLIFSIEYTPDWHDGEKADGGYSLEMVDITNPCLESNSNWRSSNNPDGGTPGKPNSISEVIPDSFGPNIQSVVAIAVDSIKIITSEKLDPASISDARYSFEPELSIRDTYFSLREPSSVYVILNEELTSNTLYTMVVSRLLDCTGNEISDVENTFALPLKAKEGEILLSEILFNPRPDGVDFVEVFNSSNNYLSLRGWKLAEWENEEVTNAKVITDKELVIEPGQYWAFATDALILFRQYPMATMDRFFEVTSLPGFNDDEGSVVLLNEEDEIVEQFTYQEDFHFDLLKDNEGVSLERISFKESVSSTANWRSAASTIGFATPGYANSQAIDRKISSVTVSVQPKVFIPGNVGSGRDFTTITYSFQSPGQFANVNIYDQKGQLIKNLVQGALLSTRGFLRWDGETNSGGIARMGYYVILFEVYDPSGNSEIIKETVVVGRNF